MGRRLEGMEVEHRLEGMEPDMEHHLEATERRPAEQDSRRFRSLLPDLRARWDGLEERGWGRDRWVPWERHLVELARGLGTLKLG
jgi:hypothetical protein